MVFLGWLQLVLLIAAAGVLAGAGVSAFSSKRWLRRLEGVAPRLRFVLLGALACFPVIAGFVAVAIAFLPSVLDALGLVADHCAHHGGHAFHLCFVHGHPPATSPLIVGAGFVAALWLLAGWSDELVRFRRVRSWSQTFSKLARYDEEVGGWTVAAAQPIAASIGLFRPQIYVSERLREILTPRQFQAVVAHEKAHAARYDSLAKLVVRLCAQLHLPGVRERLIEALDLACEQACDEAAAESVGDRLTVAEAILAVERACVTDEIDQTPVSALAFGTHALERRVRSMLDDNWQRPAWFTLLTTGVVVLGMIGASYDLLHHTAESLLALVF